MANRDNAKNPPSRTKSPRILLTLSSELLERVDALARQNYTSRSGIIRLILANHINSLPIDPAQPAQTDTKIGEQDSGEHPDDV